MGSRGAKQSEIWDSGGTLRTICVTSGTLANGQTSCPNMAILKIGPYLRNRSLWRENKLNFDPLGYKKVYVQLLAL